MNASYPTSKYKIILALSIFVFVLTFFVYSGLIDYNSNRIGIKERDPNDYFLHKLNRSLLDDMLERNYKTLNLSSSTNKTVTVKSPRIFCMILTQPKNFKEKSSIVFRTWAKDCDKFFFVTKLDNNLTTNVSHEFTDPFPILQPAMHQVEVYGRLTDKVYKTLRDLYLRYNDYDWYLKADDDTFIFVDNLKTFLKTKNSSQPVTFGFDFRTIVDRGYHSGGAGYVLSNEALQRIGLKLKENIEYCPNSGTEDVDIAKCLRKLGVYPDKSIDEKGRERFHPFDVATHLLGGFPDWYFQYASNIVQKGVESCSETSISFHYMSPFQIQKLYTLYSDIKRLNQPFNFTSMLYQMII